MKLRVLIAVALLLAVSGIALVTASRGSETTQPASMSDQDRVAQLETILRAIEDAERSAPQDRWNPEYVVEQVGTDPQQLLQWVRRNTTWIPYRGSLRGPVGVLMDRQGNSLDRARLLAALLQAAGQNVRLAHAQLPVERVTERLPHVMHQRLVALRSASTDAETDIDTLAPSPEQAARIDSIEAPLQAFLALYSQFEVRRTDQTRRLLASVTGPDTTEAWNARLRTVMEAFRDHWWVQLEEGTTWTDLDPISDSNSGAAAPTAVAESTPVDGVAPDLYHEITVRVIVERWTRGALKEEQAIEHTVRASETVGQTLVLQFWPGSWPLELASGPDARYGFRSAVLSQKEWTAALLKDGELLAQGVVGDAGGVRNPAAENPWGGLGRGIAGAAGAPSHGDGGQHEGELTAAWIEYEIRVPGESPRSIRREVFDLLGALSRSAAVPAQLALSESQRLTRGLALMMRTELLPLAAAPAPEFITHLTAQSALRNRGALRAIAGVDDDVEAAEVRQLLADAAPGVTPLFAVALGRFMAGSAEVFIDRPNILSRHQYPVPDGEAIALRDAVDIVTAHVGVDLTVPDVFSVRVAQGVLDTNAEALFHITAGSPQNTAEAFAASNDWVTITPATRTALQALQLPADARARVAADLDSGYVVVAPRSPVPLDTVEYVGWWQIDPATGVTLGVSANGWGQSLAERGVQYNVLVEMAKDFAFQYAFCQAVPQVANQAVAFLQSYRDVLPPWLPPLAYAQDPRALARANHHGCLVGAMIGMGVTATLPFFITAGRGLVGAVTRLDAAVFPVNNAVGGIRVPPNLVKTTQFSSYSKLGMSPKPKGYQVPSTGPKPQPNKNTIVAGTRPPSPQVRAANDAAEQAEAEAINLLQRAVQNSPPSISWRHGRPATQAEQNYYEALVAAYKSQQKHANQLAREAERLANQTKGYGGLQWPPKGPAK